MLTLILLTLALYFIQTLLPPSFNYLLQGKLLDSLGPRDNPTTTLYGSRARRALANMAESMVFFLPLAILAIVLEPSGSLATTGATIFLVARLAYVPLYLLGVPVIRSAAYFTGAIGLVLMAIALF